MGVDLGVSGNHQTYRGRFGEMNARAGSYALMRLSVEVRSLKEFRRRKAVLFALALNFLKLYYVTSAPVVTIVARSDCLMSLARMLHAPTRHIVRRFLG